MPEKPIIDVVLLIALPASGKSEIRTFLGTLPLEQCRDELHLGPTVQLDDFPYVHLMRRIDQALNDQGEEGVFFWDPERQFRKAITWGTLIQLLNEDFRDLCAGSFTTLSDNPGIALLERFEDAQIRAKNRFRVKTKELEVYHNLPDQKWLRVADSIHDEAARLEQEKKELCTTDLKGKTIVIEFARGGPAGSAMPLRPPFGYQYSLSQLSEEILNRAVVLYIWVTPEESRRKNKERADPDDPGSILRHGVPDEVMFSDYGCDDIDYLIERSGRPNAMRIVARGKPRLLRIARFDNRVDKTTFVRNPPETWTQEQKSALYQELKKAVDELVE